MANTKWRREGVKVVNVLFGGDCIHTFVNDDGERIKVTTGDSLIPGRNLEEAGEKISKGDYQRVYDEDDD